MHKALLPYPQVPQLAKTDIAYSTGDPRLAPFFQHPASPESFDALVAERRGRTYPRADLVEVLRDQYRRLPEEPPVLRNIEALRHPATFTVTTAHQPSLFLGPLYFLYKALTTINLAETAEAQSAGKYRVVPVFVLGSEDHDLDELNTIHLYGKKLQWQSPETGAVGSMSTASLAPVLAELRSILGESEAAQQLFARVERAYAQSATIADATQAMLHDLFGPYGLVVLNMNDARLKRHFVPIIQAELTEQASQRIVSQTIAALNEAGFKTQATPRDINLFYMKPGVRERITAPPSPPGGGEQAIGLSSLDNQVSAFSPPPGGLGGASFSVLNSDLRFSLPEILAEAAQHPERFSPNVVLRPLFQEMVLPNLAYVGGGGELAYWLERRAQFEHFEVPYPMLVRRNSALWLDRDANKKLAKFGFTPAQFFGDTEALVRDFVEKNASGEMSLDLEISDLKKLFDRIAAKASATDPTLEKAVRADEAKAVASLEQWQGRLVRAEKQKHEVTLNQMRALKEKLFPNNGLQERTDNFMPYLLKYGEAFVAELKAALQPFEAGFVILEDEG